MTQVINPRIIANVLVMKVEKIKSRNKIQMEKNSLARKKKIRTIVNVLTVRKENLQVVKKAYLIVAHQ